jgi:CHAD domain-containing protein
MARELPAESARYLARLLRRTRRRYRKRLARCQEKFSEAAVHELRVENRRALALLDLMQAINVGGSLDKPRKILKRRLDAFDDLRDAQVESLILKPLLRKYPEADEFEAFVRRREQKLVAQLRREIKALKPRRVERMLKTLEKDVAAASGKSERPGAAGAALAKPLNEAFRRAAMLRRRIRRVDTETIHRTRIAFKTFRYLCELLEPFLPWLTARRLRDMHAWQTRMGDIQDMEVLLAQMERVVKHGEVRLKSVKRLHAALARRLVVLVNQFVNTADRLEQFRPRFDSRLME